MSELGGNSKEQLRSIIERVENIEEQRSALACDVKDVYTEAKGNGFDVKALRQIVRIRKQDPDKRRQDDAVLDTYMHALGMLA